VLLKGTEAIVLTVGEPQTEKSIESVLKQSTPFQKMTVIDSVVPAYRAMNMARERATYEKAVLVNADTVLKKFAFAAMIENVKRGFYDRNKVLSYKFRKHDAFAKKNQSWIKMFCTDIWKQFEYKDILDYEGEMKEQAAKQEFMELECPFKGDKAIATCFEDPSDFQIFSRYFANGYSGKKVTVLDKATTTDGMKLALDSYSFGKKDASFYTNDIHLLKKEYIEFLKQKAEMTVVCCLWGKWSDGVKYVNKLNRSTKRHLSVPHRFICFTDNTEQQGFDPEVEIRKIEVPSWKGNLPKLAIYDPKNNFTGRVLVFDLDHVIVGSLDDMATYKGEFCTREDHYKKGSSGGDLIGFNSGYVNRIWDFFNRKTKAVERMSTGNKIHGSFGKVGQERIFYREFVKDMDFWERIYPGQIISYRLEAQKSESLPQQTRIITFHGKPKPHQILNPPKWMVDNWCSI